MPSNLRSDEIVTDDLKQISPQKADELSAHKLEVGDVLLPRRGDLTKIGFVHPGQEGWICGTGTIRIRLPEARGRRLLFYAFGRPSVSKWLEKSAVGTTMPNLNSSIVGDIDIFWPKKPMLAKELIAKADTLIRRLEDHGTATKRMVAHIVNGLLCYQYVIPPTGSLRSQNS